MKAKLVEDSNPDDPTLKCPICRYQSKFLWDHGCERLQCPSCGQVFDGVSSN